MKLNRGRVFVTLLLVLGIDGVFITQAADHMDVPTSGAITRPDANLTDFHAFTRGANLILSLSTNAAIPTSASDYIFPTDVTFDFNIDNHSVVVGGIIADPSNIRNDITFRVTFRGDGSVNLRRIEHGLKKEPHVVNVFAGLRDDPFIRANRAGRNIAAVVIEVPISSVLDGQSTIITWADSRVNEFIGQQHDSAGQPLYTMFTENQSLNLLPPWEQGSRPDVLIFDTSKKAAFPNGRALEDDVVDLRCTLDGECRLFNEPDEGRTGPKKNDVPFLKTFPYLAPPHEPPEKKDKERKV